MLEDNAFQPSSFASAATLTMAAAIDQEADLPATGRYTLIHLMVPHVPYVLDADCRTHAVTKPVEQSACAMKLAGDLLDELERLDRFEESTIVIHGDHGGDFQLVDGELVALPNKRDRIEWIDARSRPVLLIKPAGVPRRSPLVANQYPAALGDVLPTVFDSVGLELDVAEGRTSLLHEPLPARSVRYFHFYSVNSSGHPSGPIRRYAITEQGTSLDEAIEP